jgi:microcystin-dependent protein
MAFAIIDETKPSGSEKISTADNYIRELKAQMETNLAEISGYPNNSALKQALWTTSTRPSTNLVNGLFGFNATTNSDEHYYDGSWVSHGTTTSIVQSLIDAVVPIGTIMMWSGSIATIPSKWALCNGSNGTINLVDRFIVGAGSTYNVGATGGEATHTLTINEMPSHSHSELYSPGLTTHAASGGYGGTNPVNTATQTGLTGGGEAHENRPPYYALAYIQRIS